jgi:hypothetical protein
MFSNMAMNAAPDRAPQARVNPTPMEGSAGGHRGNEVLGIGRELLEEGDQTPPLEVIEIPHRGDQQGLGFCHATNKIRRYASNIDIGKTGGCVLLRQGFTHCFTP